MPEATHRMFLRAVALSLAAALGASAVPALVSSWEFAVFVLFALTVFWAWVGLGMSAGLFILPDKLRPARPAPAYATTMLTALLCGGCLYAGGHDLVLGGLSRLLRYNVELAGYYLVWLQLFYLVLAFLASVASALAGCAVRSLRRRWWRRGPDRHGVAG